MKKNIPFLSILFVIYIFNFQSIFASEINQQFNINLISKKVAQAYGITYHPSFKNYYTTVTKTNGESYVMIYDKEGNFMQEQKTNTEILGIWFNWKTFTLDGFDKNGLIRIELDEYGLLSKINAIENSSKFTGFTAIAYDAISNGLCAFKKGQILYFNCDDFSFIEKKKVDKSIKKGDINRGAISASPVNERFIGLVNFKIPSIYLLNPQNLALQQSLTLPAKTVVSQNFGYSFTNGMYFFFDSSAKKWLGFN